MESTPPSQPTSPRSNDPAHPADAHVHRHRAELLGAVELFQGAEAVLFFCGVVLFSVSFFFFFFSRLRSRVFFSFVEGETII